MAYYLEFPESGDYVELPAWTPTNSDNWSFEVDIQTPADITTDQFIIGQEESPSERVWKIFLRDGNIGILHESLWTGAGRIQSEVFANTRYKVAGHFDGSEVRLYLDSVLVASTSGRNLTTSQGRNHLSHMGLGTASSSQVFLSAGSRIYSAKLYDSANLTAKARDYQKQTLLGSNDTTFPDTVGGNDGTLINFPTDNRQWVFYDDGGGTTLDANVTFPSLTATGNASATLPQPTLSASINLTQLSATGSASATLPNPQLSASITLPSLTAVGNAAATLPNPALSALITMPIITASGNASATLPGFNLSGSITLPVITATGAAQATLPQPILTASVNLPTLTATGSATATEPSFTLSGNVTLPTITATGAASATLPQPTLSGNITLPSIQVSGFLVGGEIVITINASTNINEPTLSTNITEPTLSTNISE